ncbi:penicillin-binding protein 2 [Laspinema olomoucense]|uniref:penicillin-binding protein 2 n=1 Tax=Laspinema olomoucense TaxID=3231600 RepID=UPI003F499C16
MVTGQTSFFSKVSTNKTDTKRSPIRPFVLMSIVTLLLGVCGARLAQLQIIEGEEYRQRAEDNRIRLIPIPAARGNLVDRKGKLMAANRLARAIYLWPREQSPQQWRETAKTLGPLIDVSPKDIIKKINETGYASGMPVRIAQKIDPEAFVTIAEAMADVPGIEVRAESSRYYPEGNTGAHVLGYIGEATQEDLMANPDYPMGIIIGKMGIEKTINSQLTGVWGNRLVEVNANGEEIRELGVRSAISGEPLKLTLDAEVQKAAERALGYRRGAVVVLDVKTGGVLAMASGPSFDPNIFTRNVRAAEWQSLQELENPFLNRALQGYPPGSTFKMVTAAAGMGSGKYQPDSYLGTSSYIVVGGIAFHEHSGGYGVIGFQDALAYSSNTFFYQIGMEVGPEAIAEWGGKLGIGESTSLELLGLDGGTHGMIPTPEEKLRMYNEPWYAGDSVTMGIGQGMVLCTPLELAVMSAVFANGGNRVKPHLLASQSNTPATKPEPVGLSPEAISVIKEGMVAVVQKGTARVLNDGTVPLSGGKTGTSEVLGQPSHALFVGFAPAVNPEISIAVVVENGGYGGVAAAPVALEVYRTYFKK